ncbi:MAG: type II secretion system F family protein, partial [bacterium]|nr:type II secretion system F family protein [bacterium]
QDTFPLTLTRVIRAAERSGQLESALDSVGRDLEQANALRGRIVSALIYPSALVALVAASLVLVVTVVIPEFRPLFDQAGAELPGTTLAVLAISEFMLDYWWALLSALLFLMLGVRASLRDPAIKSRWDGAKLVLPLFGKLIIKIHAAQGSRLMAMMLRNGVPVIDALTLAKEAERNVSAATAYQEVIDRVRSGGRLGATFHDHPLFRGFASELIGVGEHSGTVDESFARIAAYYDESAKETLERLVALLAPALTIVLGLLVALVIASVLLALLSVNSLAV